MIKALLRTALVAPSLFWLAFLPLPSQAAGVTGSGHIATEVRALPEFQAIHLGGSMDLQVRQGPSQRVQVQADDNLLPPLQTEVESTRHGATLKVGWKAWQSLSTKTRVQVTVVLPRLSALTAAGSGDIRIDAFNTPGLELALSGSGDARLDGLSTDKLAVKLSGSGDVAVAGKAGQLQVSLAGSGDVRLADLVCDDVKVAIAGSGDVVVNAQKSLDVSIAGSGDVRYVGSPAVKSRVAGSGSVSPQR